MRIIRNFDWGIFLPMIFLISFGTAVIFSTDPSLAKEQMVFGILGLILFLFISFTQTYYFKLLAPFLYILSLISLVATVFLGVISHGSTRWISLGFAGLTLQTSELSKFFIIAALALFFASKFWNGRLTGFFISFFIAVFPAVMIYLQPDLGTAIVILSIWFLMLLSSGFRLKYIIIFVIIAILAAPVGWQMLKPYQKDRITTFLNPSADPLGSGYHILQAKIAIGSGQIFGRGFGQGTQSRLRFLPEYHNDFIFAALSEEWGLVGSGLLLTIFAFLMFRILSVYSRASDEFNRLLCLGVFTMIFTQFVINVGMNLGLAPVTGIPLPLVSSGGSSLVTTALSLGLVHSVAIHNKIG